MRPFLAFFLLGLAAAAPALRAQQKPRENADVLVAVKVAAVDVPTSERIYFQMWQPGQSPVLDYNWAGTGPGTTFKNAGPFLMHPNEQYQATLSSGSWQYGELKFNVPAGYSIWINGHPAATFRVTSNPWLITSIELRADSGVGILPAGEANPPSVADLVWAISAGTYANGIPAGSVQLRASSLSSALLDPTSLTYTDPGSAEVVATRHSDGALLELRTFQFLLYVRRNATAHTGYDIEIYSPYTSRTSGTGDGPYSYDDSPYRVYRVSDAGSGSIRIERFESTTTSWTLSQSGSNWTRVETSSLRTITLTSSGTAPRVETVEVKDNANVVSSKIRRSYQDFGWGQEELVEEVDNPDATNGPALTTTYTYGTAAGGGSGKLESVTRPDGSWVRYVYDDSSAGFGNLIAVYQPWQDSPGVNAANATSSNCLATLYSYAPERTIFNDLPAGTETRIGGVTVGKNTLSYAFPGNAPNGNALRTETLTTYTASGSTLVSTRSLYNPTAAASEFLGRTYAQTSPDGTKVSFHRFKGQLQNSGVNSALVVRKTVSSNTTWCEYRYCGFSTQVQDSVLVNSWEGESFSALYMVPNRSTVEMDVYDDQGRLWWQVPYVFTGATGGVATFEQVGQDSFGYANGRPFTHGRLDGSNEITWWINGYQSGYTAADGSYVEYTRDALGRDYMDRKFDVAAAGGYPAQGILYTFKTFDASGRTLTEKLSSSSTSSDVGLVTTRVYNLAGQLVGETAPTGLQTTYAYSNGGRTVTMTLPGGGTRITERWIDGSLKSVTGTAVVPEYHQTDVNSGDGTLTKTDYVLRSGDLSAPTSAPRWSRTTTDWAGRLIKEEHPAPPSASPSLFVRQCYYNSAGQLGKCTETGLADRLTEYNAWQQPYRTGLDLNADGDLDLALSDRITETDTRFEKDGGGAWWTKTTTQAYHVDSSGTPVTTSVAKVRFPVYLDPSREKSVAIDVFGNQTVRTVAVDPSLRLVTETITHPDSSTSEVNFTRNGLPQKRQSPQGLVSWTYYDDLGRVVKQTDPRADTSATARIGYYTSGTGALGQLAWRDDGDGNRTSFTYESSTGRLASTTNALGKVAYQSYNTRGQATRSWGETTYPVEYGFDDYGQQTTLSTFRGGTGWTGSTWPGSPGTADTTTWAYDNATGLLTSKTDAASHAVSYTYNARGQLATRTWGRGTVSTYSYDSGTAEQTGISYSDSTPALTYTYNRLGQTATVADVTGTRTFAYSATTTALNTETFPSYFDSRVLTRKYDTTTTGALGRNTGYTLSGASGSGTDNDVSYGYDTYGRFSGITTPSSGPAFTYGFTANSNLIASISETSGWTETNTYEAHRNLLTQIKGQFGTPVKAQFDFTHDALGRRLTAVDSGEIFSRYNSSALATHYGYNDRSEVTSAQSYYGTSTTDTSSPVIDRGFTYAFDNIGNRTSSAVIGNGGGDTHTTTYTNNALNQVTARAGPGSVDVTGLAPSAATITVNSASTTRQGDFYYKNVTAGSTPAWLSASVTSSLGGSGTRYSFVPPSSETHTYDADGNLTADGRWSYTWDAENRLVAMETVSGAYAVGVPRQLIQFKYDYLGRRVRKTVSAWGGSAYVASLDRKFIYNGWNLLAEYDVPSSGVSPLASAYIWGLDLSGNLVDGGGVGGLLAIKDVANSAWHLPYYDANGNLHALADRASGTLTAAYEYSPFGETLRATGAYAAANPFRFSTKYADAETQLLYYGYRYYNPSLGRWLGRDPLGESGGVHLYAFCRNNGINAYDRLGMIPLRMDDIWDEDMPDTDFVNEHQPTWVKVGESAWYDPVTGIQRNYKGHSEAYYASLVEGSSMGPVGGTINPSLLQQINSTFAWSASFSAGVSVAQAIEAANSASANGRLRSEGTHAQDAMAYDKETGTWKTVPGSGTNFGTAPAKSGAASGNASLSITAKATVPFSSATLEYSPSKNSLSGNVSLTPSLGQSLLIGPTVSIENRVAGSALGSISGTTSLGGPFAVNVSISVGTTTLLGIQDFPWPTKISVTLGVGEGASGTITMPRGSINLINVSRNFDTGEKKVGGALIPDVEN